MPHGLGARPASERVPFHAAKSTAKRLAAAAQGHAQNAAATLLFHLFVAAALGRYGRNIS